MIKYKSAFHVTEDSATADELGKILLKLRAKQCQIK